MRQNTEYNGWTNYATWRVHLEMLDGYGDFFEDNLTRDVSDLAAELREYVDEHLLNESDSDKSLVYSYAHAFIMNVNFHEIAQHIIDEYNNWHCRTCHERTDDTYCPTCAAEQEAMATYDRC
jgi:rRNA maturation endonuclease Nob1